MIPLSDILDQINRSIQSGNFKQTLTLCREHWKSHSNNPQFRMAYARSVYHLQLKSPDFSDINGILKSVKAVFELAPPPNLLAFHSLKTLIKSPVNLRIFKLIITRHPDILNPNLLSLFLSTNHTNVVPADAIMKNLMLLYQTSKVLHQIGEFSRAHEVATIIINHFPIDLRDTHNILFWSNRIKILSEFAFNPSEQTANEFKNFILSKKDWFLYYEAAKMYVELNLLSEAIPLLFSAVADIKKPEKDVPLRYKALLLLLQTINKYNANLKTHETSSLSAILTAWLSASNLSDKIPHDLKNDLYLKNNHPLPSPNNFINELRNAARSLNIPLPPALEPPLVGIIHSWFPDKGYGFVEHNKQTYYFNKIDRLPNANILKTGIPCEFILTSSFDKKKNKPSFKAILLKLITEK